MHRSHASLELPPLQVPTILPQLIIRPSPLEPLAKANGGIPPDVSQLSSNSWSSQTATQKASTLHTRQESGRTRDDKRPSRQASDLTSRVPGRQGSRGRKQKGPVGIPLDDPWPEIDDDFDTSFFSGPQKRHKPNASEETSALPDYVQLPKPTPKKTRPATLPAVLSGLKTVPPNAPLFPPISTTPFEHSTGPPRTLEPTMVQPNKILYLEERPMQPPKMRVYSGKARKKWDKQETDSLLQGVAKHGIGSWKKILKDSAFTFNARNSVDLKDRFRTCCPQEYRNHLRSTSGDLPDTLPAPILPGGVRLSPTNITPQNLRAKPPSTVLPSRSNLQSLSTEPSPRDPPVRVEPDQNPSSVTSCSSATTKSSRSHKLTPEDLERLGISGPFPTTTRRGRRAFTEEEDASLYRGYVTHGPLWSRIRSEPQFGLESRRATDLRDRFRNRFPEKYAEAGFKLRPESWPNPPERTPGRRQGLAPRTVVVGLPGLEQAMGNVRRYEMGSQHDLTLAGEDVPIFLPQSPGPLFDWDDATLPPFAIQGAASSIATLSRPSAASHSMNESHGSGSALTQQPLDHIHPLLTYNLASTTAKQTDLTSSSTAIPMASLSDRPFRSTSSSSHRAHPRSPLARGDHIDPHLLLSTRDKSVLHSSGLLTDNPRKSSITLPPPTDLLPSTINPRANMHRDLGPTIFHPPFPHSSSFSTDASSHLINHSTSPAKPTLSVLSSTQAPLSNTTAATATEPATTTTAVSGNTPDLGLSIARESIASLLWMDMATHPIFALDGPAVSTSHQTTASSSSSKAGAFARPDSNAARRELPETSSISSMGRR